MDTTISNAQQHSLQGGKNTTMTSKAKQQSLHGGKKSTEHQRHFVIHDYHDHAQEDDPSTSFDGAHQRGMPCTLFPMKLHEILEYMEDAGMNQVACWAPHGRCFFINRPQEFVANVLPR
jgi:HSF-type DNA-binding